VSKVSLSVYKPFITSTNFITGTGFIKCIPMTLFGLCVTAAILVIEIDEVFEAKIELGSTI
jgi:hypothetical protein